MKDTVLLTQAIAFIEAFVETSELDYDFLVKDMNEVFQDYDWIVKPDLPESEKARWKALHSIGVDDGLNFFEANEFLKNTDPAGEHHIVLQRYLATRWLNKNRVDRK